VLAINAEAAPRPRAGGSTAMETTSARSPRMQVTMYPHTPERPKATRKRSRHLSENSANKLRSYASLPKLACSIERMRSRSARRKRRIFGRAGILLSFILARLEANARAWDENGARNPAEVWTTISDSHIQNPR